MNTNPQMWPPDRSGFKREPGSQQQEALTTFEKIIRYAEKDDMLLYATALFGIVMPAVMYFVYRSAHSKYQVYAKKKREEKRKERAKKRAITFFYMATETQLKRIAFSLAEQMDGAEPSVVALIPPNLNILYNYKGTVIFLVPDNEPSNLTEADSWFFDWLQEMRFEAKEKNLLTTVNYAVFAVTKPDQEAVLGKMSSTLTKRLNALDAKEIQQPSFIWTNKETDMDMQLEHQAELLRDSIKDAWEDYNSDESDLMSADDTDEYSNDDHSEPELDPQEKKTN
ncbi:Flavodoxin-like domain-containing protein [Aphelenchoides bicaudatus]|nr:Flavodoxin-like domain-containing protein [Aphelenchoides bicaudatus]